MKLLMAMVRKDLKLLFRDKTTLFFTFAFPLFFAAFFGSIFSSDGSGSGMSVAVSDLDQTVVSEQFIQNMEALSELGVQRTTETEARELTRKGKKVAYIILPAGFGADYAGLFSGNTPEVIVGVDPSRKAEAGMLQGVMMKLGVERFESAFSDTKALSAQLDKSIADVEQSKQLPEDWQSLLGKFLPEMKDLINQPGAAEPGAGEQGLSSALMPLKMVNEEVVVSRDGPANAYAVTMPQAMFWAIMGVVMGFGVALVQEKTKGTMGRLVVAPISRVQILGGKALGCFFALVFVVAVFFAMARLLFDVPVERPDKILLAVLSVAVAFVGIMMLLAALGKTERGMSTMGWGVMMLFAMFGGAMIPMFAMPEWMVSVSNFSPVKWAILMFEGATWRHFSYSEMLLPCLSMVVLGVVLFLAGARLLKLEE